MRRTTTGESPSIESLEALIRGGDFARVGRILSEVSFKKISRPHLARFANVANRIDRGQLAFRLLNPVIRGETARFHPPSDAEKLEYAETLRRMGLASEALELLAAIDARSLPIVKLRMSFCLFSQWRYAEAIPFLREFLTVVSPGDYLATIARVNLAAALIFQGHSAEALEILEKTIVDTKTSGLALLHGNCLELMAQAHVHRRHWPEAFAALERARQAFPDAETKYSHFLFKWGAIAKSLRDGRTHPELVRCRESAVQRHDYETQRECDLYVGLVEKRRALLYHVYFGTPFESYRKRIEALADFDLELPPTFDWSPGGHVESARVFDLTKGKVERSREVGLEAGQLPHRLMIVLCSDFYKPVSIGTAFSRLFPDEHFQQIGSANRIAQIVKRLRQWLSVEDLHAKIEELESKYRFDSDSSLVVRVPRKMPVGESKEMVLWKSIVERVPAEVFTKRDVIEIGRFSTASAKRLLSWAVDSGQVEVIGSGKQRRYKSAA